MSKPIHEATQELIAFLQDAPKDILSNPSFTVLPVFRNWLSAAYDDPDFLVSRDYLTVFGECHDKPVETLTLLQVRSCITFLIRQMRCTFVPYPCIIDGSMVRLLNRWLEMNGGAK